MNLTKQQHFAALFETSEAVRPLLESVICEGTTEPLRPAIASSMEVCLERRRDGPLLRPLLARMCYEATTKANRWQDQIPVLAAVELLNISTYQSNYAFDEKAGVNTAHERNNQFICSMLTLSKAIALVEGIPSLPSDAKAAATTLLTKANHEVYQGQFCDLNDLNLDYASEFKDLDSFLPKYFARCDLIAGSTFRVCAAAALVNNPAPEVLNALFAYLGALGSAAQMVNDLGDYIPSKTKDYALPYSDLQLGRLTLPTYMFYKGGYPLAEWRECLRLERDVVDVQRRLDRAIKELELEQRVRTIVKTQFFPIIRSNLLRLEQVCGREAIAPFWFAYPYIYESRLLRYFRKDADMAWTSNTV